MIRAFRTFRPATAAALLLETLALAVIVATPVQAQVSQKHAHDAARLIEAAMSDSTASYDRLALLVDRFGPRLSGSENLERAIEWIIQEMKRDGLQNVRGEPVMVPHWVRGEESLVMTAPRAHTLPMLGLGGSVATPADGVTAEALVVTSFADLEAKKDRAKGRIVVFDVPFTTYGETVQYRTRGAAAAAQAGAVASLIRSVASFSMQTPHTGTMSYDTVAPRIPAAAISVEDAMMLHRMQHRGERIVLTLRMGARTLPDAKSHNVVAEIVGSEKPDEIVVLGGHIDSWDVGQGAVDDAGGCVAAWEAVRLMKELGLKPRRTVRVVLWTNEENGLRGAREYARAHPAAKHVLAIESDAGVFEPSGFGVTASDSAFAILQQVGRLLEPIGAGTITRGGGGADISPLMAEGVPGAGLAVDGTRYFWYHHSHADTVDKLTADALARSTAALAVVAYVVADLPERLPGGK